MIGRSLWHIGDREKGEKEKMGSTLKSSNNSQRGSKPYALMLLLAFVAATLGVMVLHKLREKRIFTVLVKEKNQDLLTLHLLFQREKGFNQEARKKLEEMKNKVYTLRSQKLELLKKLSEMQSTISSLKDERKIIESTLKKENNETKTLAAEKNSKTGDSPEVDVLKDLIMIKDTEMGGLKQQLNKPKRVQSDGAKSAESYSSINTREDRYGNQFSNTENAAKKYDHDSIVAVIEHKPNTNSDKPNSVKDGRIRTESELMLRNETEEKEMADSQSKAKETHISHIKKQKYLGHNQAIDGSDDHQKHTSNHKDSLTFEKLDGSHNSKNNSKGNMGETSDNRRSRDDNLSSRRYESMPAFTTKGDTRTFKTDELVLSDKFNQTVNTEEDEKSGDNQAKKQGKEEDRIPRVLDSTRNNENLNLTSRLHEMDKQSHEQGVSIEQGKIHSIEVKNAGFNGRENEGVNDEGETEDSDDAETHEPEIDRDDIRRFSESDHDEEAEETEF